MTQPPDPSREALAAGQAEAYASLYDRYAGPLLRAAAAMLHCPQEAEDAVQDVFVNLARSRHRLGEVRDLGAYLFIALRNTVAARLRRLRRQHRTAAELRLRAASAQQPPPAADDELAVALAHLPARQREVIALRIDAGLTFAQIADVLGVSANTAASRYRYALRKLRLPLEGRT